MKPELFVVIVTIVSAIFIFSIPFLFEITVITLCKWHYKSKLNKINKNYLALGSIKIELIKAKIDNCEWCFQIKRVYHDFLDSVNKED